MISCMFKVNILIRQKSTTSTTCNTYFKLDYYNYFTKGRIILVYYTGKKTKKKKHEKL